MEKDQIIKKVSENRQQIINSMLKTLSIKAISPSSGGTGESNRAEYLEKLLISFDLKTQRYEYKDKTGCVRPNIISTLGFEKNKKRIWLVAHMDTVAPGEIKLWNRDPFEPYVLDGKIYARGSSDNGQDLIASIYTIKILSELTKTPKYGLGIALVADEEMGSEYGIQKLINDKLFNKDDLVIVPDAGDEKGLWIEVAEKGMLWLRFTIMGKQIHASVPNEGVNAYLHAMEFLMTLREDLQKKFNAQNKLFAPNYSTFEITKHEANVESINIIPGTEISYMDCRVLPEYKIADVLSFIKKNAESFCMRNKGVKINVEVVNKEEAAPPTDSNSEIVKLMSSAVESSLGAKPKIIGIGGGTCAAFFRKAKIDAVAWSIDNQMAHQINEYCYVESILKDAEVFLSLFL